MLRSVCARINKEEKKRKKRKKREKKEEKILEENGNAHLVVIKERVVFIVILMDALLERLLFLLSLELFLDHLQG